MAYPSQSRAASRRTFRTLFALLLLSVVIAAGLGGMFLYLY